MFQIVLLSVISAVIIVILKSFNSEIALLAGIACGIIILSFAFDYLSYIMQFFSDITELIGENAGLYKILLKITAIGFLVEFAAGTIEDMGLKSLSTKLVFVGKIVILTTALPIIYAVIELITGLIK